jgi:hypothetical protein
MNVHFFPGYAIVVDPDVAERSPTLEGKIISLLSNMKFFASISVSSRKSQ